MSIVISLISLILVVYLIVDNISTKKSIKKLINQQKEQEESIKKAFEQISGILNSYTKVIKLIQKMKSQIGKELAGIVHDLSDLYKFSVKSTKTIEGIMKMHNELVDSTFETFKDIYCDLNECDCSICNYKQYCTGEVEENEGISFSDLKEPSEDSSEGEGPIASCVEPNKIIIDPTSKTGFAKLEKVMLKSGVPKEIINNYVTYIKAACNNYPNLVSNKLIEVVWRFGNSPEAGVIKHKIIKNNKELENKMINPNAKIVKTLNKLFQKEDK